MHSNRSPYALIGSRRWGNLLGFLLCIGGLAFAYYLQFSKGLEPCPLCIFQRLALAAAGVFFLIAAIHHPLKRWGAWIYGSLTAIAALVGTGIASRHVWLQHTPESQRPACGPGLNFLLDTFGPLQAFQRVLRGSGECGKVDWTLLGFSIPELTLALFIALAAYAVFLSFRD